MKKFITVLVGIMCAFILILGTTLAAGCNNDEQSTETYTVYFVTYTTETISPVTVEAGESVTAPTTPTSDDYDFVGWYSDAALTTRYEFTSAVTSNLTLYAKWELKAVVTATNEVVTEIVFNGETITLSENALYVNQELTDSQTGDYSFNSLEECIASTDGGTKDNPVVIYLAPDVYWTDDPDDPDTRSSDNLIGLEIPQSYITLMGMTDSYEDTVLASNRGQNAGANGNYNTVGVGEGFSAYNITFGNYCNIDLVYPRDTSKNREKRTGGIVQAQVITDATDAESTDMRYYENCAFMSRLNTIFTSSEREVYYKCHIECTDDALGMQNVGIYIECTFDLYSTTPVGSGGRVLMAFLGCKFTTHLDDDKVIEFSKHTYHYAFMDCDFVGDMEGMVWLNANSTYSDDMRNIVYNNTLNGKPLEIDPDHPEISYYIDGDSPEFTAYKVGNEYNIYNLVNYGSLVDWDPLNQRETMEDYLAPFVIHFSVDGDTTFAGNGVTSRTITPIIYGYSENTTIEWSVDNTEMVTIVDNNDGTATITAENYTFVDTTICVTAKASNGLEYVVHFVITSPTIDAPSVVEDSAGLTVSGGVANLTYTLTEPDENIAEGLNPDNSVIDWYRSKTASEASTLYHVATTTYIKDDATPYTSYTITEEDIGYYLVAVITPQYRHSYAGEQVKVYTSAQITEDDVADENKGIYYTDFSTLAYIDAIYADIENDDDTWLNEYVSGLWYGGYYRPAEYDEGGVYEDKVFYYVEGEDAWTYALGSSGAAGVYGLSTTTQGARLVYIDDTARTDMTMEVTLSAYKTDSQGFGSAKQFLDIFFKYDQATMTGYGLRIMRADADTINQYPELAQYVDMVSQSCLFQLMSYENGVATPLTEPQVLSSFLKDMTVTFEMSGNTLTCSVSTTSDQLSSQTAVGMPHSFVFECEIEGGANSFGGFGFQHTGTAGEGKSGNRTIISSLKVIY